MTGTRAARRPAPVLAKTAILALCRAASSGNGDIAAPYLPRFCSAPMSSRSMLRCSIGLGYAAVALEAFFR